MPERLLLIQLRRIGDVLMTTPAVRALGQAYPQARLVYITEPSGAEVLRNNPHIDEVWPVSPKPGWSEILRLVRRMRRRRFDIAIDFYSQPKSAVLTRLSGAPRRIGFDLRGRRWAYTEPVEKPPGRRYSAFHKEALLAPLGVALDGPLPEIYPGAEQRAWADALLASLGVSHGDFLVALLPVSRQPYKVWPLDRWARLADWLIETTGAKVLPLWGPGEESFVVGVRGAMHASMLPDYPIPDLLQMAALLDRAGLYVGNDAGPRHIAIAVGTPTVGVFGRPWPENWTPPGDSRHRVVAHDPGCKSNCTYPRCGHLNCINGVTYDDVLRETQLAVEDLAHGH